MLWSKGKLFGEMYTDDQLDVLGFDPRGEPFRHVSSISLASNDR